MTRSSKPTLSHARQCPLPSYCRLPHIDSYRVSRARFLPFAHWRHAYSSCPCCPPLVVAPDWPDAVCCSRLALVVQCSLCPQNAFLVTCLVPCWCCFSLLVFVVARNSAARLRWVGRSGLLEATPARIRVRKPTPLGTCRFLAWTASVAVLLVSRHGLGNHCCELYLCYVTFPQRGDSSATWLSRGMQDGMAMLRVLAPPHATWLRLSSFLALEPHPPRKKVWGVISVFTKDRGCGECARLHVRLSTLRQSLQAVLHSIEAVPRLYGLPLICKKCGLLVLNGRRCPKTTYCRRVMRVEAALCLELGMPAKPDVGRSLRVGQQDARLCRVALGVHGVACGQ